MAEDVDAVDGRLRSCTRIAAIVGRGIATAPCKPDARIGDWPHRSQCGCDSSALRRDVRANRPPPR
jgi:hypothetical protein